jgi:hypothetical protein
MLIVDLRHAHRWPEASLRNALERDINFLEDAFSARTGRFRNLRSADGHWLDEAGTPDSHGRAIQALGWTMSACPHRDLSARAARLLGLALPAAVDLGDPRPLAYAILGGLHAAEAAPDAHVRAAVEDAVCRLSQMVLQVGHLWPWPEDIVTYDNGVIPQALVHAGSVLGRPDLVRLGVRCLVWLTTPQVDAGHLRPIGNHGWWPRGGTPARYDQQPIEAASLLEAAIVTDRVTGDPQWADLAAMAFAWFLGANDLGLPMADPGDGSCRDGLGEFELNQNRGAESTLAWLMSVETMIEAGRI